MNAVTFDTNVFPANQLIERAKRLGIEVSVVSVSKREVENTGLSDEIESLSQTPEPFIFGESRWGEAKWGSKESTTIFERILEIISNGSFPPSGSRESLTSGQRRMFRDAMILCAHLLEGRDVLVTNDIKGFISHGRRESIQREFYTTLMTVDEFKEKLDEIEKGTH